MELYKGSTFYKVSSIKPSKNFHQLFFKKLPINPLKRFPRTNFLKLSPLIFLKASITN